ncbi:hypothetical protein [Rhizobium sp. PL01]|uniref:hypothetical protein n=1 Tax=Rhizobium sp. PL01 TaxID=3085631 RepID=UPI0029818A3A|nr:hypothetical protein [Rhizobium sp. PL01]MDW5315084.1 hypothetical protein [Rhizobium sp. PL01]
MIVKGIRLRSSSGVGRTVRHLQNGDDNDAVHFVNGTPEDIRDMHRDAISAGSKYAVRHWIIAPHRLTTREQMGAVLGHLAKEFAFDPGRAVVVEHQKRRVTADATDIHWHVLVGEVDPATGRILATSYDRIKHELIARIAEFSFGHTFVPGKHTDTVVKGLRKRNLHHIANRLEQFLDTSAPVPAEPFTHSQHQETKRKGHDLPALRRVVSLAVSEASTPDDMHRRLAKVGLKVVAGQKPETWIVVEKDAGALIGALHRLAGLRKSEINLFMDRTVQPERQDKRGATQVASRRQGLPAQDREPGTHEQDFEPAAVVQGVAAKLAELEQYASRALNRTIPDFKPTTEMRQANGASRAARDDLSREVIRRSDLQRQIADIPPLRWWSKFTGSAARRRQKKKELENVLDALEREIRRKEMAVSVCRRKEVLEEKAAKESHVATVTDIVQKQKGARSMLAVLEEARLIMEERPDMVLRGLDFVLSTANARVQRSERVEDKMLDLASIEKSP